jgi:hypothetical protein
MATVKMYVDADTVWLDFSFDNGRKEFSVRADQIKGDAPGFADSLSSWIAEATAERTIDARKLSDDLH